MQTPTSYRTQIALFGQTNVGKSSLFNAIIGQDLAMVSEKKGTTTDPVKKAMELVPYGAITLIDTAGLNDKSEIGNMRIKKTIKILEQIDFAIYVGDSQNFDVEHYEEMKHIFSEKKIKHLLVITKSDSTAIVKENYPNGIFTSVYDDDSIESLRKTLIDCLEKHIQKPNTMIGDLLPTGSVVVLVSVIDSSAPKGRLILPQVQFLRDCLDYGMRCVVVRETELEETLKDLSRVDLVVTDSQVFKLVDKIVPPEIMLTSFSMMMAKLKGGLRDLIQNVHMIDNLIDGDKILMMEACTHNHTHEDIGRVKIPNLLQYKTGKELTFIHHVLHDFPEDLSEYAMVIHCGACMMTQSEMERRVDFCKNQRVPITNYGVVLAYLNNILERSTHIFL